MFADLSAWATAAGDGEFWVAFAILAAAAPVCLFFAFWFLRKARLLEDTPTSRIRSAAQGYIELDGIGRLLDGPEIVSPLTGLPCLWWEYRVEEKRTTGSGKHRRTHWETIMLRVSECLFMLDDDTGTCVVDPDGAMVVCTERDRWHGHSARWTGAPPASGWRRWIGGRYRYTERRLARGRPLLVLGWFRTEGGAGSDFDTNREVAGTLAEWKRDRATLVGRFDADGDGEVDLAEWEAARRAAEDEVRASQLERALRPGVNVVGQPPKHDGRLFLLSALPQRALTRRFRWSSAALLAGFFLTGSLGAFLAGARFAGGV